MKIAVYIEGGAHTGGGFTHQLSVLSALSQNLGSQHAFVIFCSDREAVQAASSRGLATVLVRRNPWTRIRRALSRQQWVFRLSIIPMLHRLTRSPVEQQFCREGVDLVYFPGPSVTALEMVETNYIFTVWDLCHLEQPEFPEVREGREFERREALLRRATGKAVAVIVDSCAGRELLTNRYGLEEARVIPFAFLPSQFTRDFNFNEDEHDAVRDKYKIKTPYIFYPAQFWAHKNHVYLLEALSRLRQRHQLDIHAVFSGVDKGNQPHVLEKAEQLGVSDLINCIGFADDSEMPYLYSGALALTMPTYFGPTNIPPLDAFSLGCPVCYSDLPCFRDQVGEAAYFMDLDQPDSLLEILLELHTRPDKTQQKTSMGLKHLEQWSEQHYWIEFERLLIRYERKQGCWR